MSATEKPLTPTRRAHAITAKLIDMWIDSEGPSSVCECDGDGCKACEALEKAMRKLVYSHWSKGQP